MLAEGKVGPVQTSDQTINELRQDKTAATVVTDAHGRYQEAVYRGGVYCLPTAAAGVALASANASLTAATAQPIVGFLNPVGSGVVAVVLKAIVGPQATGASAVNEGIYVWQIVPNNASTSISGTVPTSMKTLLTSGSKMIGSLNQAFTGNLTTWVQIKPFVGGFPRFAAPTASINVNGVAEEEVAGLIQIPPGSAVGLFTLASGTTITSAGALIWEEIAL